MSPESTSPTDTMPADFFRHADDRFDVIVHAAAVVGGRAMIDGNPLALAVNLELDAALFQWALPGPGRAGSSTCPRRPCTRWGCNSASTGSLPSLDVSFRTR